jgi:uncharacterized protein (TIGR03067 family)
MRLALVVLVASAAPGWAAPPRLESDPEFPPTLQGTWEFTSAERGGKAVPAADLAGRTMVLAVQDGALTLSVAGGSRTCLIEAGAGKAPRAMDLYSTSWVSYGQENGRPVRTEHAGKSLDRAGIYALDGDTLRICVGRAGGGGRPTAFATAGQPDHELYVLTRRK